MSMSLPNQQNITANFPQKDSLKEAENTQELPRDSAKKMKESPLQDAVVEIRFLAHSWLDDFEKQVFNGNTVDELLNQKNYE